MDPPYLEEFNSTCTFSHLRQVNDIDPAQKGKFFSDLNEGQLITADEKVAELYKIIESTTTEKRVNQELEHQLIGQTETYIQEKQAFSMISNDIQGLVLSSMQDMNLSQKDPQKISNAQSKLQEVNKLLQSMQKHLNQVQEYPGTSAGS